MVAAPSTPGNTNWSSRLAFVLAAVGSAVGLGNLWRFPTEAGANGGGAFVLIYILCVVLIGLPLLLSETIIGRHAQQNAVASTVAMAHQSGASGGWAALAWFGMLASFMVLTFYSVVAGWVLYFIGATGLDWFGAIGDGRPFAGAFSGGSVEDIRELMPALFADPVRLTLMHLLFAALTIFVVARGVNQGIEKAATWLMPAFFILLLLITIYSGVTGDFGAAFSFLFTPDFSRVFDPKVLNSALGQAFFSLSLGSAIMVTYGAYASRDTNLAQTSAWIAAADTSVALIAGLAIFPVVFAVGLDPAAGPTLMFQTLPSAFHAMPGGALIALLFFVLAFFAALTSSVSLLEVVVAWISERFGLRRPLAALLIGGGFFVVGLFSVFAFNIWEHHRPLAFLPGFEEANWFDAFDGVTGRILLPLSGLITAVFIGWIADRRLVDPESGLRSGGLLPVWRFLVAWLCPIAVGLILVFSLFPQLISTS
ncbi:MAG TPA: sodium-dependent transporter [Allosphingosinicella sp.]|nr:sodium-dependent transporter [Allosphingosinicella sp.]